MKRYFYCILWICIAGNVTLFGNVGKDDLRERVYVQTDKHLYLAGEPVLMKLFTTDPKQIPLTFSKVAYVELVADSVARLQIKVELADGAGSGRMLLPADLPTGYYRLIVYTQFMRNEGAEVFFEKYIAVLNTFQSGYNPVEEDMKTEYHFLPDTPRSYGENENREFSLQSDKETYTTRTHGELIINGLPQNIHTLSVSIAGKELIPVAESDTKPDELYQAYLTNTKQTKQTTEFDDNFLPEYEGHIVTGKIIDNQTGAEGVDNNLLVPALSFPGDGIRFFPGQKTKTGDVRFFTTGISEMKEIATVVYDADNKYRIDVQSPFVSRFVPKPMPALYIDSAYYGQLLERSVALQVFHYFSDDPSANRNISEPFFKMKPSQTYLLDEYTRFTTMREVFIEFIIGARFRRADGKWRFSTFVKTGDNYTYGTAPLVLLDGVPITDHDVIYNYDPLVVERINIYYGPCNVGGYLFDGIIELTTYRRIHQELNPGKSTQISSYDGPQLYKRFDTPDYSNDQNRQRRMPDSRQTLLWNPDVRTEGKTSIRFPFDTSDLTGEFQATVEGITKDGKFIFATSIFKVER